MTLADELQAAYREVKEAMAAVKTDNIVEYDMLLAAGFRSAWASALQRAHRAPPTAKDAPAAPAPECSTSPGETKNTGATKPELSEVLVTDAGKASVTSAGAVAVVASLLSTHALTSRQYRSLCAVMRLEPPAKPTPDEVRRYLLERQALEVLTA